MSASMVQAVLASRLRPHLKLPALCIAWHCSEESGQAWMSKATLARECSVTERNVYRHIEELMNMGVLKRSRKGGGRVTSQYEFDFGALAAADASTPDANAMAQASANDLAQAGKALHLPLTPAPGHTCSTLHLPLAHTSGEKDERKASPSLSSKSACATTRRDTTAGRASAQPTSAPSGASPRLKVVPASKPNSQQPPSGEVQLARVLDYSWTQDIDAVITKGRELGVGSPEEYLAQGRDWQAFRQSVINRAFCIKSSPASARGGATR